MGLQQDMDKFMSDLEASAPGMGEDQKRQIRVYFTNYFHRCHVASTLTTALGISPMAAELILKKMGKMGLCVIAPNYAEAVNE